MSDSRSPDLEKALLPPSRKSSARGGRGAGSKLKWRCHECGEIQVYWSRAEAHADKYRHHRIEVVL